MILRSLAALGYLCAALLPLLPHAASAQAPRICKEEKEEALAQFAKFHDLATRNLIATRAVAVETGDVSGFAEDAARYIGERQAAGLLVFAWDETDLCLFFWSKETQSPDGYIYVRLPGQKAKLLDETRFLSDLIRIRTDVAGRLPRKRSMSVFEAPEVPGVDPDKVNAALSEMLFPPQIRNALAEVDHLSIVPVGPISTIPLFMLRPLGDQRAAVDLFSINILTLMEDIQAPSLVFRRSRRETLIIANPTTTDSEWDFPDLPGAENEGRFAFSLFGGMIITREDATLARFEEFAPSAELIIVAAHGVADSERPLDGSFLALADARLTPRQIQSLSLHYRPLVVLSACQSGLGQALDAGVIGLARAFQIAGAANTVMSLWSVDDDATRFLMENFYRLLAKNEPATALRMATLETKKRYADPAQWAAFALFGGPMK